MNEMKSKCQVRACSLLQREYLVQFDKNMMKIFAASTWRRRGHARRSVFGNDSGDATRWGSAIRCVAKFAFVRIGMVNRGMVQLRCSGSGSEVE